VSRRIGMIFGLGLLLALVAYGCASSGANEKSDKDKKGDKPGAAGEAPKKRLYPVRVQTVAEQPVSYELAAVGNLEAQDIYQIDARVPGTLYDVNFNEGDEVTPEQVLCRIAPEAYKLNALKAESSYKQALANAADTRRKHLNNKLRAAERLREARLEETRRRQVKDVGAISDEEIEIYESKRKISEIDEKDFTEALETEIKMLEAVAAEREAVWKIALDDVKKSIVMPPFAGVIEKKMVTSGMYVTAGTPLATMVDRRALKLHFKVPEKESGQLKLGSKVHFSVPAYPGQMFDAEIYHVSGQLELDARTISTWARITNPDWIKMLRPGYFASVKMTTGGNSKALVVPATAVMPTEKGFVSYVIKGDRAEQRLVTVGLSVTDNQLEIISGLNSGDAVVIEGGNNLQDGVEVKIVDGKIAPLKVPDGNATPAKP
jgi:membrane fusion protein, multidrug efflux system